MPDMHWGYGFPIGGVAATDLETGVISPGGVGYDINCGVRLAVVPIPFSRLSEKQKEALLKRVYETVPSGVGHGQKNQQPLSDADYRKIVEQGARFSLEAGYGLEEDLLHSESHGCIEGGSLDAVSKRAQSRGKAQLGTIGSGNHFAEIGAIEEIFDSTITDAWGIAPGTTYVLIHSGSRGFGHQICQDTLDDFMKKGFEKNLPDPQLVAAPLKSPEGERYFQSMAAAANFAFNNRQRILHAVREAFVKELGIRPEELKQIYDVCHNIAKKETHFGQQVCVHRKGATRAFGKGHPELSEVYQHTGQPVLVPGDMGRASYLLVGLGRPETFASCCHGAGRARSRIKSKKHWKGRDPLDYMERQNVKVLANSMRTIVEEMPDAYKDVDLVVDAAEKARLASRVARLKPHLVVKG